MIENVILAYRKKLINMHDNWLNNFQLVQVSLLLDIFFGSVSKTLVLFSSHMVSKTIFIIG